MTRMRIGKRTIAAAAALLALVPLAGCGSASSSGTPTFGVLCQTGEGADPGVHRPEALSVGSQFHGTWTDYSDAERRNVLDDLVAGGVSAMRVDAGWRTLQPHDA